MSRGEEGNWEAYSSDPLRLENNTEGACRKQVAALFYELGKHRDSDWRDVACAHNKHKLLCSR